MAYKFQMGDAILSGSLTARQGSIYASGSLTDLALRDDAGVRRFDVDYNSGAVRLRLANAAGAIKTIVDETTISGSGDIKTVGALVVGAQLYGINANGAITGSSGNFGDGNLTNVGDIALDSISADGASFSFGSNWTAASRTCANLGTVTTADIDGGTIDATTIGASTPAVVSGSHFSGSGIMQIGGALTTNSTVKLLGVADATVAVAADSMYFLDDDGLMKTERLSDYAGLIAGTGVKAAAGVLEVSGSQYGGIGSSATSLSITGSKLDVVGVTLASDSILSLTSAGAVYKNSYALLGTAFAGEGIKATGGQLSVDLNELGTTDMSPSADYLVFVDANGNASKKVKWEDFCDDFAGGGITNTDGVLSTDAGATPTGVANTAATLTEGTTYGTTTFTADRIWSLPASPSYGDMVRVKAPLSLGGFNLLVAKTTGAHSIDGAPDVVISSNGAAVSFIYVADDLWKIV
tara:strand:+ start:4170 stop:5567 length:1398 start_codon:yes stop_codon:yes gene_type:complete